MNTKKVMNKVTLSLERNEIWFKTVLSLAATIAAFSVSVASLNVSKHKAKLSAELAEMENREKTPFFTVSQRYDKDKKQYVYGIVNTGGEIRQCSITVSPFLVINQYEKKDKYNVIFPLDREITEPDETIAFIYLPGFYTDEEEDIFENCIFAFSDIWMDETVSMSFPRIAISSGLYDGPELANDYFKHYATWMNTDEHDKHMRSKLNYYIELEYFDYTNKRNRKELWLTRTNDSESNAVNAFDQVLFSSNSTYYLFKDYKLAAKKGYVYSIDSVNKSINEIAEEVKLIIAELFEEFYSYPLGDYTDWN